MNFTTKKESSKLRMEPDGSASGSVVVGSVAVTITPDDCGQLPRQVCSVITVLKETTLRPFADQQRTNLSHNG